MDPKYISSKMSFMYELTQEISMGAKHSNWQLFQNNQYVSYVLLTTIFQLSSKNYSSLTHVTTILDLWTLNISVQKMSFMHKSMGAKHSNWQLFQNNQYVSYVLLTTIFQFSKNYSSWHM